MLITRRNQTLIKWPLIINKKCLHSVKTGNIKIVSDALEKLYSGKILSQWGRKCCPHDGPKHWEMVPAQIERRKCWSTSNLFWECWEMRLKIYKVFSVVLDLSPEVVVRRCSVKKVFLKPSQNSQENTCARASFINFCEIFKNIFFIKHLRWLLLSLFTVTNSSHRGLFITLSNIQIEAFC